MNLTTKEAVYPNGDRYLVIQINTHAIGHVDIVDGGYIQLGKRKIRATIEDAARAIIDAKLSQLANEMMQWREYLQDIDRKKKE